MAPRPSLLLVAALLLGCSSDPDLRARLDGVQVSLAVEQAPHDARVGAYVSSPWTFSTSSYWLEGPEGLVLIDTQFAPSQALRCVDLAEALTGKKVVLAIVLHANPDKYNGTLALQQRGVRVITSEQVRAQIPAVHERRTRAFGARYAPDWPAAVPLPESFGAATTDVMAAGLRLRLHVLGPGCSEAHVVVEWERHLFVGDLVANGAHAWLELGKTDAWLQRLEELQELQPARVHPGRGPSDGAGLLARQAAYLWRVIELVSEAKPTGEPTREQLVALRASIESVMPGLAFPVFLELGLPAEWARHVRARR